MCFAWQDVHRNPELPGRKNCWSACSMQYGLLQKLHFGSWSQQFKHKLSAQAASSVSSSLIQIPHSSHLGMQNLHPLHSTCRCFLFFLLQESLGQSKTARTSSHLGHKSISKDGLVSWSLNVVNLLNSWYKIGSCFCWYSSIRPRSISRSSLFMLWIPLILRLFNLWAFLVSNFTALITPSGVKEVHPGT